ncbi:Phospholipase A(1) LCAT3 [Platanthera guangdongensis]|uniref:Phospholipase A(1) LCAT3 n=1 Tax=Platanthera guangdongensis TaxID=2320717 RepID=A0ABR2N0D4_9ASPA
MHQLLIECPSIYELMGSLSFSWEDIPLLQMWRKKHDSSGQIHALLESYEADKAIAIMSEALLGNSVSLKLIPFYILTKQVKPV